MFEIRNLASFAILAALLSPFAAKAEEVRLVVETREGASPALLRTAKDQPLKIGSKNFRRLSLESGSDTKKVIEDLRKDPNVLSVEIDSKVEAIDTSNDPYYTGGSLWGMYSDDSPSAGPPNTTNAYGSQAEKAWADGKIGSTQIVVGVIDTGVDYRHPDLYLNIWLNPGEIKTLSFYNSLVDTDGDGLITFRDLNNPANSSRVTDINGNGYIDAGDLLADSRWEDGLDNDGNGYIDDLVGWDWVNSDNDPFDDHFHGTHVAGTIGAIGGNGVGVVGVNWKVLIVPLKFLNSGGSGYSSDGALAVDYFTGIAAVNDKEFVPSSPATYLATNNSWGGGSALTMLQTAINNGAIKNINFVAAAGNSSTNIVSTPFYPASYSTLSAAGWEAVLPVASIASDGTLSGFSNYGTPKVRIGAPGSGITSTFPNNSYNTISGTSMATPHVVGALALAKASYPEAGKREVAEVAISQASPTPSLNGKVSSNGRLNIGAILTELSNRFPSIPPIWGTTGNDTITGTSSNETIAGVPATGTDPRSLGRGQVDTLTGGVGSDIFLLGQVRNGRSYVFYSDGSKTTSGASDYALITDFNPATDKIRLVPGNYRTTVFGNTTFLFWNDGVAERIAVLRNVNLGTLQFSPSNKPAWVTFN